MHDTIATNYHADESTVTENSAEQIATPAPSEAAPEPSTVDEAKRAILRQLFESTFGPTGHVARVGFEPGEVRPVRAFVRYERRDGSAALERSATGNDERSAFEALCRKLDRHAEDRRCRIVVSREDLRAAMGWSK